MLVFVVLFYHFKLLLMGEVVFVYHGREVHFILGKVMWIVELPEWGPMGSLKEKLEHVDPPWFLVSMKMAKKLNRIFFVTIILISLKGCDNDSLFSYSILLQVEMQFVLDNIQNYNKIHQTCHLSFSSKQNVGCQIQHVFPPKSQVNNSLQAKAKLQILANKKQSNCWTFHVLILQILHIWNHWYHVLWDYPCHLSFVSNNLWSRYMNIWILANLHYNIFLHPHLLLLFHLLLLKLYWTLRSYKHDIGEHNKEIPK